jgi:hypothetical protein
MPPIVTGTEIERPATAVFAYATDPARFSEWQKGVAATPPEMMFCLVELSGLEPLTPCLQRSRTKCPALGPCR